MQATIFNIQRFSLHDGPGIRTTVFMKGCPLRCAWCHNPESIDFGQEFMMRPHLCIGCDYCKPVCPAGIAGRVDDPRVRSLDAELCLRCGNCAEACTTGAREIVGTAWSVEDLLAELEKDEVYHAESGGGITFSGGEPLAPQHAPFVLACLDRLAGSGLHTAVDTCGQVGAEHLLAAANMANLVLYDLKLMDPDRHQLATGRHNRLILANLTALIDQGGPVWVRVPLIPDQTDDEENLLAIAHYLREQSRQPPVHLLPYHATGREKYARLGLENELDVPAMTEERIAECADLFTGQGLRVHIGG